VRDYGKVHSSFWSSQTMRDLSEDGRHLALYLLTCQHNTIAGAFRLPDGYVCEDMQWTAERVSKGFRELFGKGFANRCETTKWVYIAKHLEWNLPENPNQWKAARKIVSQIPAECGWLSEFKKIFAVAAGDEVPKPSNPSETVSKPEAVTGSEAGSETEPEVNSAADAAPEKKSGKQKLDYSVWPAQPSEQTLSDWLALRKTLKAPVSQTVLNQFAGELRLAAADGYSVDACLSKCVARGWRGFEAAWMRGGDARAGPGTGKQRHNEFENRDYSAGVTSDGTF
jgi:hypothetical protein